MLVRSLIRGRFMNQGNRNKLSRYVSGLTLENVRDNIKSEKIDIGTCKSVNIRCISETGWFSSSEIVQNINNSNSDDQYNISWNEENAGGSCSLIEVEDLSGNKTRILLDVGWGVEYMKNKFRETGVDKMLKHGEIDALIISHEHFDHFWGLQSLLQCNNSIPILIHQGFSQRAIHFIRGTNNHHNNYPENNIGHSGEIYIYKNTRGITGIGEGIGLSYFDMPIMLGIVGEQSLYFNIYGLGIVGVTGCCHQGPSKLCERARECIGEDIYAIYGGLHLSPFGGITHQARDQVRSLKAYGVRELACNHCTGVDGVNLLIQEGFDVIKGTGSNGSSSELYIGNGDSVTFHGI